MEESGLDLQARIWQHTPMIATLHIWEALVSERVPSNKYTIGAYSLCCDTPNGSMINSDIYYMKISSQLNH